MSYDDTPKLGATFVPGGFDDYYIPPPMPDIVAPSPQRVMAELPGQIQHGIGAMELDASSPTHVKPPATTQVQGQPQNNQTPYGQYAQNQDTQRQPKQQPAPFPPRGDSQQAPPSQTQYQYSETQQSQPFSPQGQYQRMHAQSTQQPPPEHQQQPPPQAQYQQPQQQHPPPLSDRFQQQFSVQSQYQEQQPYTQNQYQQRGPSQNQYQQQPPALNQYQQQPGSYQSQQYSTPEQQHPPLERPIQQTYSYGQSFQSQYVQSQATNQQYGQSQHPQSPQQQQQAPVYSPIQPPQDLFGQGQAQSPQQQGPYAAQNKPIIAKLTEESPSSAYPASSPHSAGTNQSYHATESINTSTWNRQGQSEQTTAAPSIIIQSTEDLRPAPLKTTKVTPSPSPSQTQQPGPGVSPPTMYQTPTNIAAQPSLPNVQPSPGVSPPANYNHLDYRKPQESRHNPQNSAEPSPATIYSGVDYGNAQSPPQDHQIVSSASPPAVYTGIASNAAQFSHKPPAGPPQPSPPDTYAKPANETAQAMVSVPESTGVSADEPNFSAFPRLKQRPANVPPSDEEREIILDQARLPVLNSSDPEAQLSWAQDALSYVETSLNHEERMSQFRKARPATPAAEHQIKVDAVSIVNFLADQQHPRADFMRGMWLEFGKFGYAEDKKEAFRSYKRAATKGFARAEYRMGMQYETTNEPVKALQHYRKGEEMGDCASCYRMGMMSLLGQHGQPQDFSRAVSLIHYAAEQADENAPQGSYVYGMLLARELPQITIPDEYLPVDLNGARIYIEKAAYLGFPKAQVKMGTAYELCSLGCEFNPGLSMHYQALAAFQGEPEAEMAISKWFLCGYKDMFKKNENLAFQYAQRAASSGSAVAEFAMGYFYEIGVNVEKNVGKALEWYEKAAKNGNTDAEGRIDAISKARTLSKKDHEEVAISRIKSRYGSQRGQRPDRFGKQNQPLPTVPDEQVPTRDTLQPPRVASAAPPTITQQPPRAATAAPAPQVRPGSVAPYPLNDDPRPASTTPYPISPYPSDNNPPPRAVPRPGTAAGFFRVPEQGAYPGQQGRGSMPPGAPYRGGGPPPPRGRGGGPMIRPPGQPAYPGYAGAPGRGAPPLQRGGYRGYPGPGPAPAGYRQPGAPPGAPAGGRPGANQAVSGERRTSGPNAPPVPAKTPTPAPPPENSGAGKSSEPAPKLPDIGFAAPEDPRNQRRLVPRKGINSADKPATIGPGKIDPAVAAPANAPSDAVQSPVMSGALPGTTPVPGPSEETASQPPQKQGKASRLSRPGKGPKTFEEMGLPQGKQEHDCIVM